jgi:hypothetical protein
MSEGLTHMTSCLQHGLRLTACSLQLACMHSYACSTQRFCGLVLGITLAEALPNHIRTGATGETIEERLSLTGLPTAFALSGLTDICGMMLVDSSTLAGLFRSSRLNFRCHRRQGDADICNISTMCDFADR